MSSGDNRFRFKHFSVKQEKSAMKVGTDGVLLGAWAGIGYSPRTILDAGAGTGLIALMLAQRFPQAYVTAVEISREAAEECRENFDCSCWSDRMTCICSDYINLPGNETGYDLIVSNPPFFTNGIFAPEKARAAARHSDCGMSPEKVLEKSSELLSGNGRVAMIVPAGLEDSLIFKATILHLDLTRITRVSSREGKTPFRILCEFSRISDRSFVEDSFFVRDINNNYSDGYVRLTKDFYINF